jgi:FtsP/CotA-like multicopper oxidase with cupredoxin domain
MRPSSLPKLSAAAVSLALLIPPAAHAQSSLQTRTAGLEPAGFEDYSTPVGQMENGVLQATFDVRTAAWRPWGPEGPSVPVTVFAVEGAPPRVPGPLIRVTTGTPVRIRIRNHLSDSILVAGLSDRPGGRTPPGPAQRLAVLGKPVAVAPGAEAEAHFTPTVPGTFFYFGRVLRPDDPGGEGAFSVTRGPFVGALIVDPAGGLPHPDERILLIAHWVDPELPGSWLPNPRLTINGRSWPHTERLEYAQGDTVRWRVVNTTGGGHPLHLHGAYFRVDGRGDDSGEEVFTPDERRLAVTEVLPPAGSMRISWVAHEPGNWVFHCHLMQHMSWLQTAPLDHEPDLHHGMEPGVDPLGGLVMGITVRPRGEPTRPAAVARRRLRLFIGMRAEVFGSAPGYGFVLQDGPTRPAADSVRFPGSPILLTRGEPVEIVVHNRADVPLGVHWHGLELESRSDGVPGWSGLGSAVVPATQPGDSLIVRMTPPRSGTFMYHVHSEPGHQLAQGLYGAFLVLEPGQSFDARTDLTFLLGSLGAELHAPPAVNGQRDPGPLELRAGTTYRLRFMHISPDDQKAVQLLSGDAPIIWQHVAKDGADLPPPQVRSLSAQLNIRVGETFDFLWTPDRSGEHTLRIVTTFPAGPRGFQRPDTPPPHTLDIPVRVR